jgi:hypothetical protein
MGGQLAARVAATLERVSERVSVTGCIVNRDE